MADFTEEQDAQAEMEMALALKQQQSKNQPVSNISAPVQPQTTAKKVPTRQQVQDTQFNADANDVTKGPFWDGVVQKASMGLVPKALDTAADMSNGNFQAFAPNMGSLGPKDTGSHQYRDQYQKAAKASGGASMAGSLLNPTNFLGGAGVAQNFAQGVGQYATQELAGGRNIDPLTAINQGAISALPSKLGQMGGQFMDFLSKKMTPAALNMIKEMTERVMTGGKNVDPVAKTQLLSSASKFGTGNKYQDMLKRTTQVLDPGLFNKWKQEGIFQSQLKRQTKFGKASRQAGLQVRDSRAKADNTTVPADQLSNDLEGLARQSELDPSQYGGTGQDVAGLIRSEFNTTPTKIAQASRPTAMSFGPPNQSLPQASVGGNPTLPIYDEFAGGGGPSSILDSSGEPLQSPQRIQQTGKDKFSFQPEMQQTPVRDGFQISPELNNPRIPLSQLNQKRMEITSKQFQPKFKMSNPEVAPLRASQRISDYTTTKAGYTPDQLLRLKQANANNEVTKGAQEIFSNGTSTPAGSEPPTAWAQAMKFVGDKSADIKLSVANQAAKKAMSRLDRRFNTGSLNSMSPFQIDNLKAKFSAIGNMKPQDAASYVYAESMMNPAFRSAWNDREKQD